MGSEVEVDGTERRPRRKNSRSTCETKEADKGAAKPSGTRVKHRPKQMALRKHATKQALSEGRRERILNQRSSQLAKRTKGSFRSRGFPLLSLKLTLMRLKSKKKPRTKA
ncbi:hypothetical protein Bca52824_051598 [Brassica carinata]|uniref:Uncharacterized protein n=1 Tax=Brassica carinata TaxID=52824 RepID=A0A8X7R378_BRACI|nr:hypothetical protein Bca52824_051598 [Brassica carinata]